MPTQNAHALLSPSSAHRWLVCTAAPHFEENFPTGTSPYAEEGTLAHAICELYARKKFTVMTNCKFNSDLKKLKADPLFQDEMLHTAERYVEYLTEKAMGYTSTPHVSMEVPVDLSEYIPESFGRCDCIMIGDDLLHITDYKHGKGVAVSARDNPQLRLYALGALRLYAPVYGDQIKRVSMGICQPRLSEEASEDLLSVEELLAWGESIKPLAREAFEGPGVFSPGDHCRFCRGKAQCRARAKYFAGFSDLQDAIIQGRCDELELQTIAAERGGDLPPILSNADIGELLVQAAGLDAWYKDLQEYATGALLAGEEIPGFKIVEGRSNRAFTDVDAAMAALLKAGYAEAALFDRKPKSLSELEKMLGKKEFTSLLSGLVVKPKGKPTLAPENDKREPYNPGAAEFDGVGNE